MKEGRTGKTVGMMLDYEVLGLDQGHKQFTNEA